MGGDTLVGEDEVTAVAPEQRDLMKGDPLRGRARVLRRERTGMVGAAVSRSAGCSAATRWSAALDKPSEFAGRAVHEWTAQVFRDEHGSFLSGQYRLMVRTEREKAREKKKYDAVELAPVHRRADRRDRSAVRTRARPRGASRVGGKT